MISIVIPAYNEEKTIGLCLDALLNQQTDEQYEVIIVDNNSSDKTSEIVNRYENKLSVKVVFENEKGRGPARRKGFRVAKGDIVLSTDADTIVPPLWIQRMTRCLRESDAVAITGTGRITDIGWFTNMLYNTIQPVSMRLYRMIFGHYWLTGFNFAIYANIYDKSGGFNRELNAQEDIDLAFRVSEIGKIKFISDIPVIVSSRRFQNGLFRGLIPYISTFIEYFFYKRKVIILTDIR